MILVHDVGIRLGHSSAIHVDVLICKGIKVDRNIHDFDQVSLITGTG